MRKFILHTILLGSMLLLMVSSTTLIFSRQALASGVAMLNLDICELPCWIGITPDQTSMSEAKNQIESIYGDPAQYALSYQPNTTLRISIDILDKTTNKGVSVEIYTLDDQQGEPSDVSTIWLQPFDRSDINSIKTPSIADLYNALGNPTNIVLSDGTDSTIPALLYRRQRVHMFLKPLDSTCNKVPMSQPVLWLIIGHEIPIANWAWHSQSRPWQGFDRCYDLERTP